MASSNNIECPVGELVNLKPSPKFNARVSDVIFIGSPCLSESMLVSFEDSLSSNHFSSPRKKMHDPSENRGTPNRNNDLKNPSPRKINQDDDESLIENEKFDFELPEELEDFTLSLSVSPCSSNWPLKISDEVEKVLTGLTTNSPETFYKEISCEVLAKEKCMYSAQISDKGAERGLSEKSSSSSSVFSPENQENWPVFDNEILKIAQPDLLSPFSRRLTFNVPSAQLKTSHPKEESLRRLTYTADDQDEINHTSGIVSKRNLIKNSPQSEEKSIRRLTYTADDKDDQSLAFPPVTKRKLLFTGKDSSILNQPLGDIRACRVEGSGDFVKPIHKLIHDLQTFKYEDSGLAQMDKAQGLALEEISPSSFPTSSTKLEVLSEGDEIIETKSKALELTGAKAKELKKDFGSLHRLETKSRGTPERKLSDSKNCPAGSRSSIQQSNVVQMLKPLVKPKSILKLKPAADSKVAPSAAATQNLRTTQIKPPSPAIRKSPARYSISSSPSTVNQLATSLKKTSGRHSVGSTIPEVSKPKSTNTSGASAVLKNLRLPPAIRPAFPVSRAIKPALNSTSVVSKTQNVEPLKSKVILRSKLRQPEVIGHLATPSRAEKLSGVPLTPQALAKRRSIGQLTPARTQPPKKF